MLRWLTLLLLLVAPVAAHADDASVLGPQTQSSSSLQQPDASGTATATGNPLQPATAGATPLQSASTGDSSSLQSMDSSGLSGSPTAAATLQQTDASTTAKLLVQGDSDQPHSLGGGQGIGWLGYAVLILLAASALTAAAWWLQRRRP